MSSLLSAAAGSRPQGGAHPTGARRPPPPRRVAAAASRQKQRSQTGGKGFGKAAPREEPESEAAPQPAVPSGSATPGADAEPPSPSPAAELPGDGGGALPAVGRDRILAVCTQVSLLVAALGCGLRFAAPLISPAVGDGQGEAVEALLNWAALPSAGGLAAAAGVAAGVTAARAALLATWPSFREASERSSAQVLAPLGAAGVAWVSVLPAVSEELLFRGALVPAVYPDWRGVAVAGLAFGVLHNSGGRNPAFAAWATAVGCAYGALLLATGSVASPVLAHSLANLAAAALWKAGAGPDGGAGRRA